MLRYIGRRLLSSAIAYFIFLTFVFFSLNLLIPGDFASFFMIPQEQMELIRELNDLDKPLVAQYFDWLGNLARGQLGYSFGMFGRSAPVNEIVKSAIPATMLVFVTGTVIAFSFGFALGRTTWQMPRWLSGPTTLATIAAYTAFPPWLVFVLTYLLIERAGFLSTVSTQEFNRLAWQSVSFTPNDVMWQTVLSLALASVLLLVLNWALQRWARLTLPGWLQIVLVLGLAILYLSSRGMLPFAQNIMRSAGIPLVAFTFLSFGDTMLITKTSLRDISHETYILTARAKGLTERQVRRRHAVRNALFPVITRFVINLPFLITGLVIVERATGWTGIGQVLFSAIESQNTFVYMGILALVGLLTLVARLFLDIAYAYLDPRVRYRVTGGAI